MTFRVGAIEVVRVGAIRARLGAIVTVMVGSIEAVRVIAIEAIRAGVVDQFSPIVPAGACMDYAVKAFQYVRFYACSAWTHRVLPSKCTDT